MEVMFNCYCARIWSSDFGWTDGWLMIIIVAFWGGHKELHTLYDIMSTAFSPHPHQSHVGIYRFSANENPQHFQSQNTHRGTHRCTHTHTKSMNTYTHTHMHTHTHTYTCVNTPSISHPTYICVMMITCPHPCVQFLSGLKIHNSIIAPQHIQIVFETHRGCHAAGRLKL